MELLKLLSTSSPRLERGSGQPEITWEDVAAALGSLPPLTTLYARVIYLREDYLREKLVAEIIPIAVEAGWRQSDAGEVIAESRLHDLINLAIDEERSDKARCRACNGVGRIGIHVCEKCKGAGLRRPTLASRARALGITPKAFKKSWLRDYEEIILPIVTYLAMDLAMLRTKVG